MVESTISSALGSRPRLAPTGRRIAVVGAGAAGTLVALHVLDQTRGRPPQILLFDRSGEIGRGVAYSTRHPQHLLNVPAGRMSAFPSRPDDFVTWLTTAGHAWQRSDFVPRHLFGTYLSQRLDQAIAVHRSADVQLCGDDVLQIHADTGHPVVDAAEGGAFTVDSVVLATGVRRREALPLTDEVVSSGRYVREPLETDALAGIAPDDTVTLAGTGLTAVDVVVSLLTAGHRGGIRAFSRSGLVPLAHEATPARVPPSMTSDVASHAMTARGLLRAVRDQSDRVGLNDVGNWREVVDGLRLVIPQLWTQLPESERNRFLRHLEPYWNVHRHRMPPDAARLVRWAIASGRLSVRRGRLRDAGIERCGLRVSLNRGRSGAQAWTTDWLVDCTGLCYALDNDTNTLFGALVRDGLARKGPHGLGLDVDASGRVRNRSGRAQSWLWAIGGLRRGCLYETTAVPELSAQAERIAELLIECPRPATRRHPPVRGASVT